MNILTLHNLVDTSRFPNFKEMIDTFHSKNIHVTAWATSMINVENPDFDMCVEKQYLVRDGFGVARPLGWWHGSGCLLDYTNPEAVEWWHSKMDNVLDMGLDGFKTDGTDPYIAEYILFSKDALGYNNVSITYRDYANAYYRDFFYYTREKRGDSLIMARPVDCQLDRTTHLCTPFAPYDVMYSGWVGDDDSTFNGLTGCMRKVIYSGWDNYANMGCDVGGYRADDAGPNKQLFIRWAQYGAFIPLMENGGGGEHRPWMYDDETIDIYRNFVNQHYRLIPYLQTQGMNSMDSKGEFGVIKPIASRDEMPYPARDIQPSTYSYILGDSIIVHPVTKDSDIKTGIERGSNLIRMVFPQENQQWVNWWNPANEKESITIDMSQGGEAHIIKKRIALDSFAVYVKRSSLLPLQKSATDESIIFTWFCPESDTETTSTVREAIELGTGYEGKMSLSSDGVLTGSISAHSGGAGWEIYGISSVDKVTFNGVNPAGCSFSYQQNKSTLSAYCDDASGGLTISIDSVKPSF